MLSSSTKKKLYYQKNKKKPMYLHKERVQWFETARDLSVASCNCVNLNAKPCKGSLYSAVMYPNLSGRYLFIMHNEWITFVFSCFDLALCCRRCTIFMIANILLYIYYLFFKIILLFGVERSLSNSPSVRPCAFWIKCCNRTWTIHVP